MAELKDTTPMPQHGKFKGVAMENVPYWYLLWLNDQSFCMKSVKEYIAENMDVLLEEQRRANKNN